MRKIFAKFVKKKKSFIWNFSPMSIILFRLFQTKTNFIISAYKRQTHTLSLPLQQVGPSFLSLGFLFHFLH